MIVDTGPLVAAANRKDPDHEACRELLAKSSRTLVVPALVVAEATFMIERAGGTGGGGEVPAVTPIATFQDRTTDRQ
ncbi:PIN domain-containing protein [Phytoactinopolyspora halophila]|uniref:PIN domain-containing protein n=1 Tax=Phytoactinopolyspora halophila TaxID=1981511 RepID=UPI001313F070